MFSFFIKKKVNSVLENNIRKHTFRNFESMKRVLILFSYQDWGEISQIVKDLEKEGKEVLLWTTQSKKDKTVISAGGSDKLHVITSKDLSWHKQISPSVIEKFKALSYDTLLDLTTDTNSTLLYLLANNQSEFCIGIKELDHKVFDFILLKENDKNLIETYNQIKFYLGNIS